jgi:hypothetical protein
MNISEYFLFQISCPVCRYVTSMRDRSTLPINYTLEQLVDSLANSVEENHGRQLVPIDYERNNLRVSHAQLKHKCEELSKEVVIC